MAATIVNLLAMASSLWLGFYIVTRSLRSLLSWLAALTMWILAGYFLCDAVLNNGVRSIYIAWLQEFIVLVIPLMLHLSFLLLPAALRRSRLSRLNRVVIPPAYALGVILVLEGALPTSPPAGLFPVAEVTSPTEPLSFVGRTITPLYPVYIVYLALLSLLTLANLWQAREAVHRSSLAHPFTTFFLAVATAGMGALYAVMGTLFHSSLPTFPADILLAIGVALVGLAVARYSALLEGRPLDRDFIYTLLVVGALTGFYVLVVLMLYWAGQVSFLTLALTIVGTIAANSLFDAIRLGLDHFFYHRQFQELRQNLHSLSREAGTAHTMPERLQAILDSLCRVLQIQRAFIALAAPDCYRIEATHDSLPVGSSFPAETLGGKESVGLLHPEKKGLAGMKLLIPLSASGAQLGALVLGPKETRQAMTDADLDLIEDLADQMAGLIHGIRQQDANARELNAMVESFREKERALELRVQQITSAQAEPARPAAGELGEEELLPYVEDALRHLHDPAYLGERELAQLRVVEQCLKSNEAGTITFIDRGKAVIQVLERALEKLKPDSPPPKKTEVPGREWHPYVILHDSYVLDEPNRDVMSRLYISEGTFNRTRRRALRGVAKALAELEACTG